MWLFCFLTNIFTKCCIFHSNYLHKPKRLSLFGTAFLGTLIVLFRMLKKQYYCGMMLPQLPIQLLFFVLLDSSFFAKRPPPRTLDPSTLFRLLSSSSTLLALSLFMKKKLLIQLMVTKDFS